MGYMMVIRWDLMGYMMVYPLVMTFTVCELENGPVEIADLPFLTMVVFHSYDSLPEGKKNEETFEDFLEIYAGWCPSS